MLVNIENKLYPEDFNKNVGTLGITFPMNADISKQTSDLFSLSRTTEQQAVSNYVNLLLTRKGERVMQPEFGVGLMYYVFEQNSDTMNILLENEIRNQADFWLPYIINDSISITRSIDTIDNEHAISIQIKFRVFEVGANRTITAFLGGAQQFNLQVQ